MIGEFYTPAPPDNPFNDIIRDNQLLYTRLDSYSTDIAKKLFLHELRAYIRRFARSEGDMLRFTIPSPVTIYVVNDLLDRITTEMEFCEERIRFSGIVPATPKVAEEAGTTEQLGHPPHLYGHAREVARLIFAAQQAGLLTKTLSASAIAELFGIKASSYSAEVRALRRTYSPPKLKLVQPFLEHWLHYMSNDDLENIILTIRKLQA